MTTEWMRTWTWVLAFSGLALSGTGVARAQAATITLRLRAELEVRDPEAPGALATLPLVEERLRAVVDGQFATTELSQVFQNRTGAQLEGRYVLRPTMDARVQGFAYYIGEERIVGEVLERRIARQVYAEVTTARRDPGILEQTADGEFTFRVFPIEPNEDKRVEIQFGEWLRRRGSTVTYRVPLSSPDASVEVIVRDARARHVRSPSHAIAVEEIEGGVRVRTRGRNASAGELELRWEIEEPAWTPSVWVHRDEGQDGYFLLSLAAPEGFEDRVSAKDVTLVLDRSGSMEGDPIVNARAAAADVIRRLGADDRLNVIAFDDDVDPLFARPRSANAEARADALEFVSRLRPGGGTDIAFALDGALRSQHERAGRPQVVIVLTDGQSAPEPVLARAAQDAHDVRVFTVGVGTGVNRALLSRLAAVKRGSFTYIDRASRIEAEVGHLYAQIAHPLLVGISLSLEGGVVSRVYPRSLPDLFVDDELVIAGRFRGGESVRFVLRGRLGAQAMTLNAAAAPRVSGRRPWVGRRWAAGRVDHLLEQIQLEGDRPELRAEVISLALAYDMVTPFTAFLAIPEREVTAAAAQTLAAGRAQRAEAAQRHADAVALQARVASSSGWAAGGDAEEASYEGAAPSVDYASAAGCASCTVGAPRALPTSAWILGLGLALALAWRRRA